MHVTVGCGNVPRSHGNLTKLPSRPISQNLWKGEKSKSLLQNQIWEENLSTSLSLMNVINLGNVITEITFQFVLGLSFLFFNFSLSLYETFQWKKISSFKPSLVYWVFSPIPNCRKKEEKKTFTSLVLKSNYINSTRALIRNT